MATATESGSTITNQKPIVVQLLHGDRRRALDALQKARRIAPQPTRFHPQVHETVRTLAASDVRSTRSLADFAGWCGIQS